MIPILKVRDNEGNVQTISVVAAPSVYAPHGASHSKGGTDYISPASIGAAEKGHSHTAEDVGAAEKEHTHTIADVEELDERITEAENKATEAVRVAETSAHIATGSYEGKGRTGAVTIELVFDKQPKVLFMRGYTKAQNCYWDGFVVCGSPNMVITHHKISGERHGAVPVTWTENGVNLVADGNIIDADVDSTGANKVTYEYSAIY